VAHIETRNSEFALSTLGRNEMDNEYFLVWRLKDREYNDCEWEIVMVTQSLEEISEIIEGMDYPSILVERYNFDAPMLKV
jgi:hypothetical protein